MLEQRLLPLLWPEQGGEASAGGAAPPDIGAGQQSPEISTRGVQNRLKKNRLTPVFSEYYQIRQTFPFFSLSRGRKNGTRLFAG